MQNTYYKSNLESQCIFFSAWHRRRISLLQVRNFFREAVSDCRQSWRGKLQLLAFTNCSVIHKPYYLVQKKSLPSHWAFPGENLATFTGLRHWSAPQSCVHVNDTHSLGLYLLLTHSLRASSTSHTFQCSLPHLTINPVMVSFELSWPNIINNDLKLIFAHISVCNWLFCFLIAYIKCLGNKMPVK